MHTHKAQRNSHEQNDVKGNTRLLSPGLLRAGRRVGGCRAPRKQTNYGNSTHQPIVMFTFGVNSVPASVCVCGH